MKLLTEPKLKMCIVLLTGYLLTIFTNTFKNDYLLVMMCMIFSSIPNVSLYLTSKKMIALSMICSIFGWTVGAVSSYIKNVDLLLFPIGGYITMKLIDNTMKKKSGLIVITYLASFLFRGNFGDLMRIWKSYGEAIFASLIISYITEILIKKIGNKNENRY
ncbi:Uncharacterised protein [Sebaldella termitidis]|uniref:Uncharacterized protein n=1 Tax=Sebaldella termitidis (strain ATCC 33386 / NCTC 11300) TaxID=526218 RepID=D1AMW9_SEBTE|nr:hypothetical protein [Sebaldella termitidis]ACZ07345.1 hypothetical protein Sterm_0468 [Sebaldella termitidis ATCC 33386]SUI22640.1 Uncharacterised protein [Sebaldella termitidis]